MSNAFYENLPVHEDFATLARDKAYVAVPDDWVVGTADIVGSTKWVDEGQYKVVNTVGAAVISAMVNKAGEVQFPYVFGGDGAAFAVPPELESAAQDALAAVKRWADDEFGMELRAALVPVGDVLKAGHKVTVARYRASKNVAYAMVSGGGLAWAEAQMKAGKYAVSAAPEGTFPDLTGLSCRWTPMEAQAGKVLCVLVQDDGSDEAQTILSDVATLTDTLERGGTPVPPEGPGYRWIPEGLELEARATHGRMSLAKRKVQLLAETFIAWLFHITGATLGGFSARHYTATTGANADFRKFDDGLKMTIDCDAETRERLVALLERGQAAGVLVYSIVEQPSAVMTCIVPSVMSDDHVHFVDGSEGGYTRAAAAFKSSPNK